MRICIYGASADAPARPYFDAARELGAELAQRGHVLVFGGGRGGLMGACAEGAAAQGGEIVGIAPRFFDEPGILYDRCTRLIYTETLRERKQRMEEESDAFVVLPGGIGTWEEFFETLTLKQLGRHAKPMAVLNTLGYYERMLDMLRSAADGGFMSRACLRLFGLCATPSEALEHVEKAEILRGNLRRLADYSR